MKFIESTVPNQFYFALVDDAIGVVPVCVFTFATTNPLVTDAFDRYHATVRLSKENKQNISNSINTYCE